MRAITGPAPAQGRDRPAPDNQEVFVDNGAAGLTHLAPGTAAAITGGTEEIGGPEDLLYSRMNSFWSWLGSIVATYQNPRYTGSWEN